MVVLLLDRRLILGRQDQGTGQVAFTPVKPAGNNLRNKSPIRRSTDGKLLVQISPRPCLPG